MAANLQPKTRRESSLVTVNYINGFRLAARFSRLLHVFKNKRHQPIPRSFQAVTADIANNLNFFHSKISVQLKAALYIMPISLAYQQAPRPAFGGNFQMPEGRPKYQAGQS